MQENCEIIESVISDRLSAMDLTEIAQSLRAKGLSPNEVEEKVLLFARAARKLSELRGGREPRSAQGFFVPGRIEVLGKHTDYAGGSSLVAAAEKGFCVVATRREDAMLRLADAKSGDEIRFLMTPDLESAPGHWAHYPKTVARRIARNFPGPHHGADVVFISDLPPASGLSTSSAMIIATFLVLAAFNSFSRSEVYEANIHTPEDLAGYLGTVENGQTFGALTGSAGVGTFGGSEDHTAILCSQAGYLSQYGYCPVRLERRIAMPPGYVFAVAASGVIAEKTGAAGAKYNRISELASDIVRVWQNATGGTEGTLRMILSLPSANLETLAALLTRCSATEDDARERIRRLEHFCAENGEVLPAAVETLARGNLDDFGYWVDRSQALGESLLQNQVDETIFLARSARELGAAAASAFGAGFGGSVWALVRTDASEEFLGRWSDAFSRAFPQHRNSSALWRSHAGPPAFGFAIGAEFDS